MDESQVYQVLNNININEESRDIIKSIKDKLKDIETLKSLKRFFDYSVQGKTNAAILFNNVKMILYGGKDQKTRIPFYFSREDNYFRIGCVHYYFKDDNLSLKKWKRKIEEYVIDYFLDKGIISNDYVINRDKLLRFTIEEKNFQISSE